MMGEGLQDSLKLVESALQAVPYGEKMLPSVRWFMEQVPTPDRAKSMTKFDWAISTMQAVTTAPDSKQSDILRKTWKPVNPFFHQINTFVADLMAHVSSKEELTKILAARFAPTTYMRKSKKPTATETIKAFQTLNDVSVSLMKVSEVVAFGGKELRGKAPKQAPSAAGMLPDGRSCARAKGAASLASRCKARTTLTGLWNSLQPTDTLEIEVNHRLDSVAAFTFEGDLKQYIAPKFL